MKPLLALLSFILLTGCLDGIATNTEDRRLIKKGDCVEFYPPGHPTKSGIVIADHPYLQVDVPCEGTYVLGVGKRVRCRDAVILCEPPTVPADDAKSTEIKEGFKNEFKKEPIEEAAK